MGKDTSNRKNVINLILVVLLIAAAVYFGIRPLAGKLASVYQDSREENASLSRSNIELGDLETINKILENKKALIEEVLAYLPEADSANFIAQAEALAKKVGGTCESIKFNDEKTPYITNYDTDEKIFEIVFDGNFSAIRNFLVGLSKLNQYNNVYSVSISVEEDKTYATILGGIYTRKTQAENK